MQLVLNKMRSKLTNIVLKNGSAASNATSPIAPAMFGRSPVGNVEPASDGMHRCFVELSFTPTRHSGVQYQSFGQFFERFFPFFFPSKRSIQRFCFAVWFAPRCIVDELKKYINKNKIIIKMGASIFSTSPSLPAVGRSDLASSAVPLASTFL